MENVIERLKDIKTAHAAEIDIYKDRLTNHKEIIKAQKLEKHFLAGYAVFITLVMIALFVVDFFIPTHGWIRRAVVDSADRFCG